MSADAGRRSKVLRGLWAAPLKTFSSVDKGGGEMLLKQAFYPDISPLPARLFSSAGQEEVTYRDIIEIMP
jgi:hypothetical protein